MDKTLPPNYTGIVEQIIRPTGLLDPVIEIRPSEGQVGDLLSEVRATIVRGNRIMVTTLTKRMAEELTTHMKENNVKVQYIHSDVESIERVEILRDLRLGIYDVLVGINLLREGIDLPEISLVAILDADKEGFLRSKTSLIQIVGRAARHSEGRVIMYADRMTDSMKFAIEETNRRRDIQIKYNTAHGLSPTTIYKEIKKDAVLTREDSAVIQDSEFVHIIKRADAYKLMTKSDQKKFKKELAFQMQLYADEMDFEKAAQIRDIIKTL